jgi:spore germination protein YaaH
VDVVYGWFPYWQPAAALELVDAAMVTHLAWFACDVDTSTGKLTDIQRWLDSPAIPWASQNGIALDLTITCFGQESNQALLASAERRAACIASIAEAIANVPDCGINIDFESVPQNMRQHLVVFSQELRQALPMRRLSICLPAVDWSKSFDVQQLHSLYDLHIVMGYDYSWSGSTIAGPVAPLRGEVYNVSRSMQTYVTAGLAPSRLVMGMPLYGYTWSVTSAERKASVVAGSRASAVTIANIGAIAGYELRQHDVPTVSAWTTGSSGGRLQQTWWDDSLSRVEKIRYVREQGFAGVALWALGYDRGAPSVWQPFRDVAPATSVAERETPQVANVPAWYVDILGRVQGFGSEEWARCLPAGRYFRTYNGAPAPPSVKP